MDNLFSRVFQMQWHTNSVIVVVSSSATAASTMSLTAARAFTDAIATVLALGHLVGLAFGDTEIADGHDAVILAASFDIGTLFFVAK